MSRGAQTLWTFSTVSLFSLVLASLWTALFLYENVHWRLARFPTKERELNVSSYIPEVIIFLMALFYPLKAMAIYASMTCPLSVNLISNMW